MLKIIDFEVSYDSLSITLESSEDTHIVKITNYHQLVSLMRAFTQGAENPIFIEDGQTVQEVLTELTRVNIDLHMYEVFNILGSINTTEPGGGIK